MSVKINLGVRVYDHVNGRIVENLPLDVFKYNIMITGSDQQERNALLSHILNQFYKRVPELGVLYIKLRSSEDSYLYHFDKVIEHHDPELIVPYFTGETFTDVSREEFVDCINALFGFHFEMKIVLQIICRHYRSRGLPGSIVDFLEDMKKFLIENPYSKEFTESNVRSIEKAIEIFEEDPILERIVSIPLAVPEWLQSWCNGNKICIDLSECSIEDQKLLVTFITQAINQYVEMNNTSDPKGIVVIDDIDKVMEKPPHEKYRENFRNNKEYYRRIEQECYCLTREQIEEIFGDKNYLRNVQLEEVYYDLVHFGFRLRNISLISVCEYPSRVYDCINSHSQIMLDIT